MIKLESKKRDLKEDIKKIRLEGYVPSIIYGPELDSIAISVNRKEIEKIWKTEGSSTIIILTIEDNEHEVLIQDLQTDPVSEQFLHIDFLALQKGKVIEVTIPVEFIGESPATKTGLGVLTKVIYEIEIETLPKNLPQNIEVDISVLVNLHDSINLGDLKLPEGVRALGDEDETIVTISAIKEEAEEEETKEIDFDSISVEKKGKVEFDEDEGGEVNASKDEKNEK